MPGWDMLVLFGCLMAVTYACRAAGFWLMGRVQVTPRVEAALRAAPLCVMVGIVAPAAVRGGGPEWAGLVVAGAVMWACRRDLTSALAAVVVVAVLRAWT